MVVHGIKEIIEHDCSLLLELYDTGAVVDFVNAEIPLDVSMKIEGRLHLIPRVALETTEWLEASIGSLSSLVKHAKAKKGRLHIVLRDLTPDCFSKIKTTIETEMIIYPFGSPTFPFSPPVLLK